MLITCLLLLGAVDGGAPGRVQLEERQGPAREITGVVLDERGAPVANARLTFRGGSHHQAVNVEAHTGSDGRFTATGVAPGLYGTSLWVEAPGYARLNHTIEHPLQTAVTLTIRLGKPMSVAGVIVAPDANGGGLRLIDAPPAGADLTNFRAHATPRASGALKADGHFAFEVLEGDYELEWRRPSGSRFFSLVHAPSSELRLTPSITAVEGQVLSRAGSPLENAEVVVALPGAIGNSGQTETDAQGRFTIRGLEDGEYVLQVSSRENDTRICHSQKLEVTHGVATVKMQFGSGWELRGQLLDGDGKPQAGVDVLARPDTPDARQMICDTRLSTTDAQGRFTLVELPDAELEVAAMTRKQVRTTVKRGAGPLTLRQPPMLAKRSVSGVVLGPDRKPIEGAMVGSGRNFTDAQGRFTLELEAGPAAPVEVYRRCFERTAVEEKDAATIVMKPRACLSVTVVDAAKKPLSGMHSLQVQRADGTLITRCTTRAAEGDCTLEAELGTLTVSGTTQDGRVVSTSVTLKNATKQDVQLIAP